MDMQQFPKLSKEQQEMLRSIASKAGLDKDVLEQTGLVDTQVDKVLEQFVTNDSLMLEQKRRIKLLAKIDSPVLILGETGTGKEIFARALHGNRKGKFVSINITAMPSELIESELFGHIAGAFTGALSSRKGLFSEAQDGTLFLDEIGDMPIDAQCKLLRAIQERAIRPVGSNDTISINCRIVCATQVIDIDVSEKFRRDLYWRLASYIIMTTPLRNRKDDIDEILDTLDCDNKIPQEIRDRWHSQQLTGNVRELQAKVNKYLLFGEG